MRAALVAALGLAAACTSVTSDFECHVDSDCTLDDGATGVCEADQRCAYVDSSCTTGYRYGDLAGAESNTCTGTTGTVGGNPGGPDACVVAEVSAGVTDTCVHRSDGSVWCFGNGMAAATQVTMPTGTIAEVDVGGGGLCARYADGTLDCTKGPMTGNIGITATQVAIGASHVCAVTDGQIDCWGSNASGELGNGGTTDSTTPQSVIAVDDAVQASAGLASTCEVETGGDLWCWGDNSRNQLAQTIIPMAKAVSPVEVFITGGAAAVAVGDQFACAVSTAGKVECWGDETKGQTGQGEVGDSTASPLAVPGLTDIAQVTAGGSHACARATTGEVWCWGDNAAHESSASAAAAVATPTPVVDGGGTALMFLDITAGAQHTCGRLAPNGALACWGDNSDGQIGDGTTTTAVYPTASPQGCH